MLCPEGVQTFSLHSDLVLNQKLCKEGQKGQNGLHKPICLKENKKHLGLLLNIKMATEGHIRK